jgi:hypothetical protein
VRRRAAGIKFVLQQNDTTAPPLIPGVAFWMTPVASPGMLMLAALPVIELQHKLAASAPD